MRFKFLIAFFLALHAGILAAANGNIITVAGGGTAGFGEGGPATDAQIVDNQYVACDAAGNLYFSDFLISTL